MSSWWEFSIYSIRQKGWEAGRSFNPFRDCTMWELSYSKPLLHPFPLVCVQNQPSASPLKKGSSISGILIHLVLIISITLQYFLIFYLLIWERERGREEGRDREGEGGRERERWERYQFVLFHIFMHSLVDSCMCPDGIKSQPWRIGMTL